MVLQVVAEAAQRPRRVLELLQGRACRLLDRRVGGGDVVADRGEALAQRAHRDLGLVDHSLRIRDDIAAERAQQGGGRARRVVHVAADLIERDLVDLGDDARDLILDLVGAAARGRHHPHAGVRRHRERRRVLLDPERDEVRAGEQISRAQLRAQPERDQALQHLRHRAAELLALLLEHLVRVAEPLRVHRRVDVREERALVRIEAEADAVDAADDDAVEVDRRAEAEAAHGAIEAHRQDQRLRIGRRHRGALVVVELEPRVLGRGLARRVRIAAAKRDAAGDDGRERLGGDVEAARVDRDIEAARVPEHRVLGDLLVVGLVDEDLDVDGLAVLRELELGDLADLLAPQVHRRARSERARVGGADPELRAVLVVGDARWLLEPDEAVRGVVLEPDIDADVRAGDQRGQTGHAADADARLLDPELGVLARQLRGAAVELDGGDDLVEVLGDVDRDDLADGDALVADVRDAGLQAVGALERDLDLRTRAQVRADRERAGRGDRDQRHDPDRREAPPLVRVDVRRR